MEKPSSVYNIAVRHQDHTKEDQYTKDRYADRMTLRGIPVLRDTDGERSAPVWRGDHSFSSDAASYSLTNFIEPEVAREHPTWSHEQVRQAAAERFEKRLRQDLSYEHKESAHEESIVAWRPVETRDGTWELATEYGDNMITLRELWEHTREYADFTGNPAAYNREEHRAQLAMQEKFIDGSANGFVSVLSHPDSIRYVQVWQKADDGTITSKQVDIYKTIGRDFTHEEGAKFIDHLASFHHEITATETGGPSSYAHFFVQRHEVREEDIRLIAAAQAMELPVPQDGAPLVMPRAIVDPGSAAIRDTAHSLMQLGSFLREQIDQKIAVFTAYGERGKKRPKTEGSARVAVRIPGEKASRIAVFENAPGRTPSAERMRPADISTEIMKSAVAEWWITTSMLLYRESIPVAPVAIISWLISVPYAAGMPSEPLPAGRVFQAGEMIPAKVQKEKNKTISVRSVFRAVKNFSEKVMLDIRSRRMIPAGQKEVGSAKPELVRNAEHQEKVTRILPLVVVEKLMRILRRLSRGVYPPLDTAWRGSPVLLEQGRERTTPESPSNVSLQKQEVRLLTRTLSIAVIVWWLIDFGKDLPDISQSQLRASRGVPAVESPGEKHPGPETPWVLLAVIWYLAALREHGKPVTNTMKKAVKKKTKQTIPVLTAPLPLSGVIFVYGS